MGTYSTTPKGPHLNLVIDCNYLCHRAIHTMGALSANNLSTGVLFGFLMQLKTFAKNFGTNKVIFAWDSKESKRKKIYPEYKNNRDLSKLSTEEQESRIIAYGQFDILREHILPLMGFKNNFQFTGYEADDILAMVTMNYDLPFVTITGDHDIFQLLDFTDIYLPAGDGKYITYNSFVSEFGIKPKDWITVKAIAGCSSDNVQGVRGVGDTTAIKYLKGELKKTSKKYTGICSAYDTNIITRNLELVTLPFSNDVLDECILTLDTLSYEGFVEICEEFNFNSFLTNANYITDWDNFFRR